MTEHTPESVSAKYVGVQYTVELFGVNTVITIKTSSEENMAKLVHLIKEYLNAPE